MDWNLFWSAFGAIGSTVGSVATAIALIIAIRQYKQPLVKRINISYSTAFPVMANNTIGMISFAITVSNIGVRPIVLSNIYLNIGSKNLILNNVLHPELPAVNFPVNLDQEEAVTMYLPYEEIGSQISKLIENNEISALDAVKILVTDTTGGNHYKKIKNCTAKKFAESAIKLER